MDAIQITREACVALRDAVYEQAGLPRLNCPLAAPEPWPVPGLFTDMRLGDIDLGPMCDLSHTFDEIPLQTIVEFLVSSMRERYFVADRTTKQLQRLFPSIKWRTVGHAAEHKLRLAQVMELARRNGADMEVNTHRSRLRIEDWTFEVRGSTVMYGSNKPVQRFLKGSSRLSWPSALLMTPGLFCKGHAFLNGLSSAAIAALPHLAPQINLLCRFIAHNCNGELTEIAMDVFDAESIHRAGGATSKTGRNGIWERLSQVVDSAKSNPIRAVVRLLRHEYSAQEVYRLFGSDLTMAGLPFSQPLRDHFLDVIADLESGYTRSRNRAPREASEADNVNKEISELLSIQELFR